MSDDAVWLRTVPDLDGDRYHVELSQGEDTVVALTPERGRRWADAVMAAVAAAEYDVAVYRQMSMLLTGVKDARASVLQVITDLRADRPTEYVVDDVAVRPGLNARIEPFVGLYIRGTQTGQWTMDLARQHVVQVLDALHAATLDTTYLRVLTHVVNLERTRAMNMVDQLGDFR